MPEIEFYINDTERAELFDFLIENDAVVVPNLMYPDAIYSSVKSKEDFLEIIDTTTIRFFVISEKFTKQALLLEQNRFFEYPVFSICQRYGGPCIDIGLYRGFAEDADVKYKCVNIHYYPKYIDLYDNTIEHKASDALREYYDKILKFLKMRSKKITVGRRKYWVSKQVLTELEKKELL